jgi:hypothetical protein
MRWLSAPRWHPLPIALSVVGVGVVCFCVLATALYMYFVWDLERLGEPPSQIPFDAAAWKAPEDLELRYRMHEDLLRQYHLVGMTETEVVQLLGPGCDCEDTWGSDFEVIYNTGTEPGPFGVDNIWLVIDVGPDGRVVRYFVASD